MGSKDMEKLAELVDASLKFTRVLKKKGVSQATLQVGVASRCRVTQLESPANHHKVEKYESTRMKLIHS